MSGSSELPSDDDEALEALLEMPTTAYLVLGLLKVMDEDLTAGEIKSRADQHFGRFFWSPAVSHIRRELDRLGRAGLIEEQQLEAGQRTITVYGCNARGAEVVAAWAAHLPQAPVVIKHPLMLKIWLTGEGDPQAPIEAIDRYLEEVELSIQQAHWSKRRARDLGLEQATNLRYASTVSSYTLRALYAELANVRLMRDEIEWRFSTEVPRAANMRETVVRRRNHPDPAEGPSSGDDS